MKYYLSYPYLQGQPHVIPGLFGEVRFHKVNFQNSSRLFGLPF